MVKSTIHPDKITYNESKQVDNEDIGYAGTRYELTGLDTRFEITLGKEKHTYSSHDVVFFPIYFIHDNSVHSKIGIVEIESNNLLTNIYSNLLMTILMILYLLLNIRLKNKH